VPHPAGLPDLFIDRSLGRIKVPSLLRAAGLQLVTLAEFYGVPKDETVEDITWLADAGNRGWAVFMKDARIRFNSAEQAAVMAHGVQCFCLARGGIRAEEMAGRFLMNLPAITAACGTPGSFIYAVHAGRIEKMM